MVVGLALWALQQNASDGSLCDNSGDNNGGQDGQKSILSVDRIYQLFSIVLEMSSLFLLLIN